MDSVGPKLLSSPARLVHIFIPSPSNTTAMADILKNVLGVKLGEAGAKKDSGKQSTLWQFTPWQCDGNCVERKRHTPAK